MASASNQRVHSVAYAGVFLALAVVASYIETLLPLSFALPGIKIGLANAVIMVVCFRCGIKKAALLSCSRIVLSAILFQGLFTILYSFAGAFLSLVSIGLLYKRKWFSEVGVSVIGAVMHNVGQIIVAAVLVENRKLLLYFPVLLISGVISGAIIGVLAGIVLRRNVGNS